MSRNIAQEIAVLQRMSVTELRDCFAETFGERARARARELAKDADLRLTPPRTDKDAIATEATRRPMPCAIADDRLPMAGTLLTRQYKGRTLVVEVLADGFQYDGDRFASLSAVAKAATGAHWNGFYFFGLVNKATNS